MANRVGRMGADAPRPRRRQSPSVELVGTALVAPDYLPGPLLLDRGRVRLNCAVRALQARVHLYGEDWTNALAAADAAMAEGYALASSYQALFTDEGTPTSEDIFRIVFTPQEASLLGFYYLHDFLAAGGRSGRRRTCSTPTSRATRGVT
jgi:hypothetical protein